MWLYFKVFIKHLTLFLPLSFFVFLFSLKVCNNNTLSLVLKIFSPNLSFDSSNDIVEHIQKFNFCSQPSLYFFKGSEVTWSKVKSLSRVRLFVTLWIVAHQAPLSMGFSRQEYWSGLPFPSPGDLPDPGIETGSPTLQAHALLPEPPGDP